MTDTELKKRKDKLGHSDDMLRAGAHLAANKYGQPILELIFLRYADVLFKQHKTEFDIIYVNSDNTLPKLRCKEEHWKVGPTEDEFAKRKFEND